MTLDGDHTVHAFDNVFDNAQSQTGSADVPRTGFVNAIEALENSRQVLGGDSNAGIRNGDLGPLIICAARLNGHFTPRTIKLYSIVEQIDERLLQANFVSPKRSVVDLAAGT